METCVVTSMWRRVVLVVVCVGLLSTTTTLCKKPFKASKNRMGETTTTTTIPTSSNATTSGTTPNSMNEVKVLDSSYVFGELQYIESSLNTSQAAVDVASRNTLFPFSSSAEDVTGADVVGRLVEFVVESENTARGHFVALTWLVSNAIVGRVNMYVVLDYIRNSSLVPTKYRREAYLALYPLLKKRFDKITLSELKHSVIRRVPHKSKLTARDKVRIFWNRKISHTSLSKQINRAVATSTRNAVAPGDSYSLRGSPLDDMSDKKALSNAQNDMVNKKVAGTASSKASPPAPSIKTVPAASGKTVPVPSGKTVPVPSGHTVPVPSGKTVPVPSGKTVPIPSGKTVPLPSGKTVPVPSRETVPAPSGKTVPAPSGKTVPAPSGKTVPAPSGKTVPAPSGKTVPAPSGKTVPAPSGKTVPAPSGKTVPAPSRETLPDSSGETLPDSSGETPSDPSGETLPALSGETLPAPSGGTFPDDSSSDPVAESVYFKLSPEERSQIDKYILSQTTQNFALIQKDPTYAGLFTMDEYLPVVREEIIGTPQLLDKIRKEIAALDD